MNSYELAWRDQTTGWDAEKNDVNGVNAYGMRPIEVAAQAGDVAEFRAIVNDPKFDPSGARPCFFADVGRNFGAYDAEKRYAALVPELDAYRNRFGS
jgi:hypothetical protein